MLAWLKKHFIPHKGNDHRPHILRGHNVRNIVALVICLEIITFLVPTLAHINTTGQMAAVLPGVLSALTNDEREAQNLQTLTINPILNKVAEMKATDMAAKGYFAHTSPEGKTPWYWLEQAGYKYQYAGENLAVDFSDSKDVASAWMKSPTHKANIIKEKYTEVGTGIATGIYEGKETVFVAQVYANPLPKITEKTPPLKIREISKTGTTKESSNILGAEVVSNTGPIQNPTFLQKAFASPRNTMNTVLFIVFGIIALALFLYIFIKIKHYHLDLITNGLIVLAILGTIFIANYYWSHKNMVITQSLDYVNENK